MKHTTHCLVNPILAITWAAIGIVGSCGLEIAVHSRVASTPVEKVIKSLMNLREKVVSEGKKESANYDKFVCFCKEQVDERTSGIERADKLAKHLSSRIEDIQAELPDYHKAIVDINKNITAFDEKIKKGQDKRDKEHAAYVAERDDLTNAISAARSAIRDLKDSKNNAEQAGDSLAQLQRTTQKVIAGTSSLRLTQDADDGFALLDQMHSKPPTYKYHADEIIATIENLLKPMEVQLQESKMTEMRVNFAFQQNDLSLKQLRKLAEKDKAGHEKQVSKRESQVHSMSVSKDTAIKDKEFDQQFLDELTKDCEEKGKLWDQRSKTRQGEITTITKALTILTEKVASKLQVASHSRLGTHAHVEMVTPWQSPAFLQVHESSGEGISIAAASGTATAMAAQKVTKLLSAAANKLGSRVLAITAARVEASKDHFIKVRSLIKDIMARLEQEAEGDSERHSFCAKAQSSDTKDGNKAQGQVEGFTTQIAALKAEKTTLLKEISALAGSVAELKHGLSEATELRTTERAENELAISTAGEGVAAVQLALDILKDFYKEGAGKFLQTDRQYLEQWSVKPKYEDVAPNAGFTDEYSGDQVGSKAIIATLETILSDFQLTVETTKAQEAAAQEHFMTFESKTKEDLDEKTASQLDKENRIAQIGDELIEAQNDLKKQETLLADATEGLHELKKQCADAQQSHEKRVTSREAEIASLKEAHTVLEGYQR